MVRSPVRMVEHVKILVATTMNANVTADLQGSLVKLIPILAPLHPVSTVVVAKSYQKEVTSLANVLDQV